MNYKNCLTIGVDLRGIYLSVLILFRFGHSPLFVPWEDVQVEALPRGWFPRARFTFSKCPGVPLVVTRRLAQRILEAGGRQHVELAA